jgi:hypothetical protein
MQFATPFRILRRSLMSSRRTDIFRSRVSCFITQSFVQSYLTTPRNNQERRLLRHGRKVYSQNDEDGIIAEIFNRIGTASHRFVEIGAADGLENNTLWLLLQGWSGTWIEADQRLVERMNAKFAALVKTERLTVMNEFVTRESVRKLEDAGHFRDIDLFSLDIDGNDYHIINALTKLDARLVVLEYNGKFPPPHKFVMKYNEDPHYHWDMSDYFGASLESWNELLKKKGYSLVGCNITGVNAFFVRDDLIGDKFAEPFSAVNHYEPPRYWLSPGFVSGHPANFGEGHHGI